MAVAKEAEMAHDTIVSVIGIARYRALTERVTQQLTAALGSLRIRPISVRAAFANDDGSKRGGATRCGLTVRLPHRPALHVEHVAETPHQAFERALVTLERGVERYRERVRDSRRRPKKYYAAKRLESDAARRKRRRG